MRSRPDLTQTEPPTLSGDGAIALVRRQLDRLSEIGPLRYDDPRIQAWESTTCDILDRIYGKPAGDHHEKTDEVINCSVGAILVNATPSDLQRRHQKRTAKRQSLLEAYIEQLGDGLTPPMLSTPQYVLHPQIEAVSMDLLRGRHFKQAALEAYIRVINEVKTRSGLSMDGDTLMNHAFGCDTRHPVLAFNSLSTESEKDEQRGIMYLFKGIVGLRNAKAHSNTLFSDLSRAHEYLALASLLMRLLEIAKPKS